MNKKVVNFLDITLDLNTGLYTPYKKENNTILYINSKSNHPPSTIKNISENVNNRLTRNSANEQIFNDSIPPYKQALATSGHSDNLKFDPNVKLQQHQVQYWQNFFTNTQRMLSSKSHFTQNLQQKHNQNFIQNHA